MIQQAIVPQRDDELGEDDVSTVVFIKDLEDAAREVCVGDLDIVLKILDSHFCGYCLANLEHYRGKNVC